MFHKSKSSSKKSKLQLKLFTITIIFISFLTPKISSNSQKQTIQIEQNKQTQHTKTCPIKNCLACQENTNTCQKCDPGYLLSQTLGICVKDELEDVCSGEECPDKKDTQKERKRDLPTTRTSVVTEIPEASEYDQKIEQTTIANEENRVDPPKPTKEQINSKIKQLNEIYHANPTPKNYENLLKAKKEKYNPTNIPEEDISITDMQTEDIQRLIASFIFCVIGTLASDGNMFWTMILFIYMILMGLWWASDKQEELAEMGQKRLEAAKSAPNERKRGSFHYKVNPGMP